MKIKNLSLTLILLLCGCNNNISSSNKHSNTSSTFISSSSFINSNNEEIESKINEYFNLLKETLPNYINEDLIIPLMEDDSYKIEITASENLIFKNILVYEDKGYDYNITLNIKVTKGNIIKKYSKDINIYSLINPVGLVFLELDKLIPSEINHDLLLPQLDDNYINYLVDYSYIFTHKNYDNDNYNYFSSIETNRLVYDYPSTDKICNLTAKIYVNSKYHSKTYPITIKSTNTIKKLPKIEINVENNQNITSKEDYLNATFKLTEYLDNNEIDTSSIIEKDIKIKGRGNSTWEMPKKPYALKFDKKLKLLNGVKSKNWCLLANHADQSLMRNYLALTLGNKLDGLDWNPTPNYVEVYLNNEYLGNYVLTEKVSVGEERVNVLEETFDVNSGYLVEMDARAVEEGVYGEDYFTLNEGAVNTYAMKSPEKGDDYYSIDKVNYIKNYMQEALNAVKNDNYESYIDIDSFIDWYIVNEVFQSVDAGYSSVYFNKDKDGKLKIGPLWDLDLSAGNPGHLESYLRVPTGYYVPRNDKNIWYYYLLNSKTFQDALKNRWNEIYDEYIKTIPLQVFKIHNVIGYSAYNNFNLWDNVIGIENEWYTAQETLSRKTYQEQLQFLHDFLKVRINWLNTSINNNYFIH